jgi:hypothetical protein
MKSQLRADPCLAYISYLKIDQRKIAENHVTK